MRRLSPFVIAALVACSAGEVGPAEIVAKDRPADCERTDLDTLAAPRKHTPRWAFEPWISKDISDRDDTYAFVDGFRSRGIPVGAVVLDSPWETHYNTFVPSPTRYRDFPGLVRDMHERGVRVVLWVTQMTNETGIDFEPNGDVYTGPAPNFEEGQRCKYFVDDGMTYVWWKGRGSAVDFFDPHARAWWHRQQDVVLNAGIDGWKLDFGETYMRRESVETFEGTKPFQEYSERYYEDYLAYGRMKRGDEFVTMVRAWDKSYEFPGRFFARKEHAPVAWMGDNLRDWSGLADALDHTFVSARAGYPVVGSDVGGYLDRGDQNLLSKPVPFDTLNFARWTAVGALSPFMQLHGRANLAPWTVPDHEAETVALYKYWATLHHELVPFFYDLAEEAWAGGPVPVRPIGEPATWPNDYRYQLGDAFLVAPILDATGQRSVPLPEGARFYDWWTTTAHDGGTSVAADYASDRLKIPLFVREGAVVPMKVDDDPGLTLLVYPSGVGAVYRHHPAGEGVAARIEAHEANGAAEIVIENGSTFRPFYPAVTLRVRRETEPSAVHAGGAALARVADRAALLAAGTGWTYDASTRLVHVRAQGTVSEWRIRIDD